MKTFVKVGAAFSGLLLVVWPFLSLGAAFMDAPTKGPADMAARCTAVLAIWSYPLYWRKSRKAANELLEEEAEPSKIIFMVLLPSLVLLMATLGLLAYSP